MISNTFSVLDSGVHNTELSDHQLIYCFLKKQGISTEPKTIIIRDFKNIDVDRFQYDLERIPFFGIYDTDNIEQKVLILEDNIKKLFDIHAPLKSIRCTKPPAPWLTNVIKTMIKIRDKALGKFKKDRCSTTWNFYKEMRNLTSKAIKREKKSYYEYALNNCSNKDRWRILKSNKIVANKKVKCSIPEKFSDVQKINDFFVNSLPVLTSARYLLERYDSKSLLKDSFKLQAVDNSVILTILSGIKSTATGDDGLNIIMIKLCFPHILPFVRHIINFCILHSVYPSNWKKAVVMPLPKRPVIEDYKDLRAVSILPVLSKLIEKVIALQLMEYVECKRILPDVQSGFRKKHSCSTALLQIIDDVLAARDIGEFTVLILLDFTRAFDTLDHKLLLQILKHIGIDRHSITFFENYLSGRMQRVVLNGNTSPFLNLTSGVPQGSVLGPLLFIIYTSQLESCLMRSKLHLYADDTQLYCTFKYQDRKIISHYVNEDLKNYVNLCADHCLLNNAEKTKVMLFGPQNKRDDVESDLCISISGVQIPIVDQARSLGVILDSELRFSPHITKLLQQTYAALKTIYASRSFLTLKVKINLCESLVLSILNYADIVYGPHLTVIYKQKIQKVQNSCLRLIYGIRRGKGVSHKLSEIGWLNMHHRRLLHAACLYHRIIICKKPIYLYAKIKFRTDVHTLNIRFKGLLSPPRFFHEFFKRSFTYQICSVYNSIPKDDKRLTDLRFKSKYKQILFNRQTQP
nr:unnamed protein product [Callosobruchus analis]CAI5834750.1 unnamed protein product [Callosobruchus analis]CAI5835567.1 unnamed protein product [Callosobruchus analis]CAI5840243.1 unnamed protein product [Callosobruchus analis]